MKTLYSENKNTILVEKKMMKKLTIILTIAICLGITTNTFAQKGKPTSSPNVFVTAEFSTSTNGIINKVTMDNPAVPYQHNVDGVSAQFYVSGTRDLVIQLTNSSRYTVFDLSQTTSSINAPNWISTPQWFRPGMNILEAYRAKENCQPVAGIYDCNFVTRMNAGYLNVSGDSATYALLWNPETTNSRPVNSPENTSFVNVNYYKGSNGQEVFTITPLPNCATRSNNFTCGENEVKRVIAGLEKTKGRNVSGAGQYEMPFTLVVRPL